MVPDRDQARPDPGGGLLDTSCNHYLSVRFDLAGDGPERDGSGNATIPATSEPHLEPTRREPDP